MAYKRNRAKKDYCFFKEKDYIRWYFLAVIVFLILTSIQIRKPLMNEEIYFPFTSENFFNPPNEGITNYDGYGLPNVDMLPHPPLYFFILAISIKLLGYSLISLKLPAIIFTLLTSYLIVLLSLHIFPDKKKISWIAASIYLLHPLVLQSALIVDIDGGLLSFLSVLTIYLFLKYGLERPFYLGGALFLLLMAKLPGYVLIVISVFLYIAFFKEDKIKNLFKFTIISFMAALIFIILFYYISQLIGTNFSETFTRQIRPGSVINSSIIFNHIFRSLYAIKNLIIWLTPPFVLFLMICFKDYFYSVINKTSKTHQNIMWLMIIIGTALYVIKGVNYIGFAKHFVFIVPFASILFAENLERNFDKMKDMKIFFILSLLIFIFYFIFVGDPFFTPDVWMISSQMNIGVFLEIMLKFSLIILPAIIIYLLSDNLKKILLFISILFILYSSIFTSFAPYSTNIHYGDTGLRESISFVRDLTQNRTATIIAPHQFNFIWNEGKDYSVVENNAYLYPVSGYYVFVDKFWMKVKLTPGNTFLVIYPHDIYRTAGLKEHIGERFRFIKQIGNYRVYKIKQ